MFDFIKLFILLLFGGFYLLKSSGEIDLTKKTTGHGCNCHGSETPSDSVKVWIEGPRIVQAKNKYVYKIFITGGPSLAGGFNLASWKGRLNPIDEGTRIELVGNDWELTHDVPKVFINDTVNWSFSYTAPENIDYDTLYAVGNSVDLDGLEFGDEYNFSENFIIKIDCEQSVDDNYSPTNFFIRQNYPNPFNAITKIEFGIYEIANVKLELFDMLGRVRQILFNEHTQGTHVFELDASNFVSGVYCYTFSVNNKKKTNKFVLLK